MEHHKVLQSTKDKVSALLKAEGVSINNKDAAIKSLSETVMPTVCISAYRELLSEHKGVKIHGSTAKYCSGCFDAITLFCEPVEVTKELR